MNVYDRNFILKKQKKKKYIFIYINNISIEDNLFDK